MRILMLHNRYRASGGEERAVGDIAELLTRRGHTVQLLQRSSQGVTRARASRGLLAGGLDPDQVADAVRGLRAEVVHAHNVHPLFGWRALAAARSAGARTVLHLHNFRLFCAIAVGYRDGAPCFRCSGRDTRPGLRLRCRGSLGEAAVYAAGLHLQQPRLIEHSDRLVAVSASTAARLIELGLPAERTSSLLNFVPASGFASHSTADQGRYALVIGRLVAEKGFDTAIAAARAASVPLVVVGDGPDGGRLRGLAAGADVRFTGRLPARAVTEVRRGAGVVLVPSRSEDACPYAALDALAAGVPVLGGDRGGLPEVVGADGLLDATDPAAWATELEKLWHDPAGRRERGRRALARARERFSEERYHARLVDLYRSPAPGPGA